VSYTGNAAADAALTSAAAATVSYLASGSSDATFSADGRVIQTYSAAGSANTSFTVVADSAIPIWDAIVTEKSWDLVNVRMGGLKVGTYNNNAELGVGGVVCNGTAGFTAVNKITEFSTDGTLSGNSDVAVPTEKAVKTYVDAAAGGAGFASYCSVYLSGQTLTTDTDTKITFDTEKWDNNSEFDAVTNHRFVAKVAGVYHVSVQLMYLSLTQGVVVQCKIKKNGTVVKIRSQCHYAGVNEYVGIVGDVELDVDEYIEIWGEHEKGSDVDINSNVIATFLDIHRIA